MSIIADRHNGAEQVLKSLGFWRFSDILGLSRMDFRRVVCSKSTIYEPAGNAVTVDNDLINDSKCYLLDIDRVEQIEAKVRLSAYNS